MIEKVGGFYRLQKAGVNKKTGKFKIFWSFDVLQLPP